MANPIPQDNQVEFINRQREEDLVKENAKTLNLPYLDLRTTTAQYEALTQVEEGLAREANIAIIQKKGDNAQAVVEDPNDPKTKKILVGLQKKYKVKIYLVSHSSLEDVWQHYPVKMGKEKITGSMEIANEAISGFQEKIKTKEDLQKSISSMGESNASQVFEVIIGGALHMNASDVHIEPDENGATIRMRIDGILYEVAQIKPRLYKLLISRIKLLSQLKLNVHDTPQEGRFSIVLSKTEIEMRTSILPSEYGEDVAMRVLDPRFLLSLRELGMRADIQKQIEAQLSIPSGLILTTGPTGSGKTTTLYAFVKFLKSDEVKIITIEDPVEYHIDGISQTQINIEEGYTFESGLRSILRQDPDIVLISELRDMDSADAALHASLAGRRVLTTLHTNDAAGAIPRLTDMGIDVSTISSGLSAVIAQRLIRKLCESCKVEIEIGKNYEEFSKLLANLPKAVKVPKFSTSSKIYAEKESGCVECNQTGYNGRVGIFEIMITDKEIREKILEGPSEDELKDFIVAKGMVELRKDAIIKILEGLTSIEEINRVLGKNKTP